MSEAEKREQIGKLAEEYSTLRGELAHVNEKLARSHSACSQLANVNTFNSLRVINGQLQFQPPPQQTYRPLEGLLGEEQLKHFVAEKHRLMEEVQALAERLKTLAPHLL